MITLDRLDELKTTTAEINISKRSLIDKIWWTIWKQDNHSSQSMLQEMFDIAHTAKIDEMCRNRWRVR